MAVNFKHLLNKPSGEAKKPEALPAGDYPAIIRGHEMGESSKKKTPYIRFHLALTGWPDEIGEDQRVSINKDGSTSPIDLSKKQLKCDFYLTDDSLYRLDDFLKTTGLASGRTYEELIPECHGLHVVAEVRQEVNEQGDEATTYNKVDKIVGIS